MLVCALCVLALLADQVQARPYFQTKDGWSTATITHEPEAGHGGAVVQDVNKVRSDPNIATSTSASKAQYKTNTLFDSTASTTGFGGIGYSQSSTAASAIFSSGSGVSQDDPEDLLGASLLNIDFDLHFKIIGSDLTSSVASASLILAGTVGPLDGLVALDSEFKYYRVDHPTDPAGSGDLLATLGGLTYEEENTGPTEVLINGGSGFAALADAATLSDTVPKYDYLRITGFVEFAANNAAGPSENGFSPDFDVRFDTISDVDVLDFQPDDGPLGSFEDPANWGGRVPDGNSVLRLFNEPGNAVRAAFVGRDTTVRRVEMAGGSGLFEEDVNMRIVVEPETTLEVLEDVTLRRGSGITLGPAARLIVGRSLIDGTLNADGGTIVIRDGTVGMTGELNPFQETGTDLFARGAFDVLTKDGPGTLVVFSENFGLLGNVPVVQGALQLQQPYSLPNATFDIGPEGVLSADFDFTSPNNGPPLLERIAPSSSGVLASVSADLTGPLNLSGHGQLSIGAVREASILGPVIPGTDPATGQPTYRFGGGGGTLNVLTSLGDVATTPTSLIITGPDTKVILGAANSFSGRLVVENGATLGLGAIGALGDRTVNVDYDGLVYEDPQIDSSNVGAQINLTGTAQATGLAQIGWNGDKGITDLAQVGHIVGSGAASPAGGETRILGLGATGDSGVLTLGVDISNADAYTNGILRSEDAPGANGAIALRLVLGGPSTVDLRGRNNTHTGGTHILAGTVLGDALANLGAPGTLVAIEQGARLEMPATLEPALRGLIKSGRGNGAWQGPSGITSPAAQGAPVRGAVGHATSTDSGQVSVMFTILGDTDLDGTILIDDYENAAAGFTGPGGSGKGWGDGDSNYDDDVDNTDLALILGFMDLVFGETPEAEPTRPLLTYDWADGRVLIDATGASNDLITNFLLLTDDNLRPQNFMPPLGQDCGTSLCTAEADEISWSDFDGFRGEQDLGAIAPRGLRTLGELNGLFTQALFVGEPGTGILRFDMRIIPEPSALGLLLGLGVMLARRRRG